MNVYELIHKAHSTPAGELSLWPLFDNTLQRPFRYYCDIWKESLGYTHVFSREYIFHYNSTIENQLELYPYQSSQEFTSPPYIQLECNLTKGTREQTFIVSWMEIFKGHLHSPACRCSPSGTASVDLDKSEIKALTRCNLALIRVFWWRHLKRLTRHLSSIYRFQTKLTDLVSGHPHFDYDRSFKSLTDILVLIIIFQHNQGKSPSPPEFDKRWRHIDWMLN
jgi:hypothetical protein